MFKLARRLVNRFRKSLLTRLEVPNPEYRQRIFNNMPNLYQTIRKGDIVLVEGRAKISQVIKLFSNSSWSHLAMYVGDELIQEGQPHREKLLADYGDAAHHMVIEAYAGRGVIATPLHVYRTHNIRLCRPYKITAEDLKIVLADVIDNLGKHYDEQNIIDIALMMLPAWISPFKRIKRRSIFARLGSCNDYQVICSGMVAHAFQRVGFPIVPALIPFDEKVPQIGSPYGARLQMRHYSQILPRDFDLSPNFEIVKFNIIITGEFDYRKLPWADLPIEDDCAPAPSEAKKPAMDP